MTEIEQLRKEVNELRERVAQLEWSQRKSGFPEYQQPQWMPPAPWTTPVITCKYKYDPHYAYY